MSFRGFVVGVVLVSSVVVAMAFVGVATATDEYENEDGLVDEAALGEALDDYISGDIEVELLVDVYNQYLDDQGIDASDECSSDNPLCDDYGGSKDRESAEELILEWVLTDEIDGEFYTRNEIEGFVLEWVLVDDNDCGDDNPFCDDEGNPLGEDEVDAKLEDYDDDGKIDGEEYTDLEIIEFLDEWREHTDDEDVDVEFEVVNLEVSDDPVEGDVVELEATFENQGAPGAQEVELYVEDGDGSRVVSKSEDLVLDQDEEGLVEVEWMTEFPDSGGYTAYASSDDDVVSMDFTVTPVEPELLGVSHSPDVAALETPEGREDVTVELEVRYATSVELTCKHLDEDFYSDDDENMEDVTCTGQAVANPDDEEVWTAEIEIESPGMFPVLTEYDFSIENHEPVTGLREEIFSEEARSYRAFKHVDDIAVIYAKFDDSEEGGSYWPDELGDDLNETQEFKQERINEYMAGWQGSWGGVGFDFTFYDDEGSWFTTENPSSEYDIGSPLPDLIPGVPEDEGRFIFHEDAREIANDIVGYYDRDYSSTIAVSPGGSTGLGNLDTAACRLFGPWAAYVNELDDDWATWIHELGHCVLYRSDLYEVNEDRPTSGDIGFVGIMGSGSSLEPAAPFSLVSRSDRHNLYTSSLEDERGDLASWPWVDVETEVGLPGTETELELEPLEAIEYGDELEHGYRPPLDASIEYLFESRGTTVNYDAPFLLTPTRKPPNSLKRGVYMYRIKDEDPLDPDSRNEVKLMGQGLLGPGWNDGPSFSEEGDELRVYPSDSFLDFELTQSEGKGADYDATITAEAPELDNTYTTGSYDDVEHIDPEDLNATGEMPRDYVNRELDLVAFDEEGNKVGLDRDTYEYEFGIQGVDESHVSGNQPGFEWIAVPGDQQVRFEINASGIEDYITYFESKSEFDREQDIEDNRTNLTITLDWYDVDAEHNETTGEIDNHYKVDQEISVTPGESTAVAASAEVTYEPETLNKRSQSRWIEITMKIPHEEIDVSDIDLSTVRLNDEVEAETDDQYGFVRNPVDDDTLKVKFPRDEVTEVLETGEDVRITVTGETTEDELIVGWDTVRVIEEPGDDTPANGGPPRDDCPGERVGPVDDTPGEGPPDCPPAHSGEHPSEDDGSNDTPPGQQDDGNPGGDGDGGGSPGGGGDSSDGGDRPEHDDGEPGGDGDRGGLP